MNHWIMKSSSNKIVGTQQACVDMQVTQPAITCSRSAMETSGQCVKSVQS